MNKPTISPTETAFRTYYGKLYASLLYHFGTAHETAIEDAIQTTFYKALKSWKPSRLPVNQLNWLFITARNELLNQLKKRPSLLSTDTLSLSETNLIPTQEDPRLVTLMLCGQLTNLKKVSTLSITLFALKNIFGLSVKEIAQCTLVKTEAVYKNINRTKRILQTYTKPKLLQLFDTKTSFNTLPFIENLLYSIFTVGYDTLDAKATQPMNEDICFEAVSLVKILLQKWDQTSSKNLLALFCFHLSRFPARFVKQQLIPFFEQDRTKWNKKLMDLGYYYLSKPNSLDGYYIEALIVSKHMHASKYDTKHWTDILHYYELLIQIKDTPIIRLNRIYCLRQIDETDKALSELKKLSSDLPDNYLYYMMMRSELAKDLNTTQFNEWLHKAKDSTDQGFRKVYIETLLKS